MQGRPGSLMRPLIAGLVLARCRCCEQAQELLPDPELDEAQRVCPASLRIYLDRGDGLFEDTGRLLPARSAPPPGSPSSQADLLSDRPSRSEEKSRIVLERATFARR